MTPWVAISLGDVTGIGPEVTLKALAAELPRDETRYLIIGDDAILHATNERFQHAVPLCRFRGFQSAERVQVHNPSAQSLSGNLPAGAPSAARAALDWLRAGTEHCQHGETVALVTAPVSKEAIIRSGEKNFAGQTELLSALAKTDRTAMMLLGCDDRERWLRVTLATNHVPIADVARILSRDKIELAIRLAAQSCHRLQLPRARVGVCGLNPHAGEGGKIGTEEQTTIQPAVDAVQAEGIDVHGPFAADTLFHFAFRGDYDAIVAMYHDQGLVPLKMIGFDSGVNWTLGLPFIRTSPDHGTAYDIAGQGIANPSSMIAALRLAKQLARTAPPTEALPAH